MTQRTFFQQMGIVSAAIAVVLVIIYQFMPFQPDWGLGLSSWIMFVLLTLGMFFSGKRAAQSSNKHNFTSLILGVTVIKMFLAIGVVFLYASIAQPTSRMFVVPFLMTYFFFTIYETYVLMVLSKEKPAAK